MAVKLFKTTTCHVQIYLSHVSKSNHSTILPSRLTSAVVLSASAVPTRQQAISVPWNKGTHPSQQTVGNGEQVSSTIHTTAYRLAQQMFSLWQCHLTNAEMDLSLTACGRSVISSAKSLLAWPRRRRKDNIRYTVKTGRQNNLKSTQICAVIKEIAHKILNNSNLKYFCRTETDLLQNRIKTNCKMLMEWLSYCIRQSNTKTKICCKSCCH
jgi:hypothetical protein